jgi:hypothetical protein
MTSESNTNIEPIRKRITNYIDDQAGEAGMTRRQFLGTLLGIVGFEVLGAGYVVDMIEHGWKSKTLLNISTNFKDTPANIRSASTYIPLTVGIGSFSLLVKSDFQKYKEQGGTRRAFLQFIRNAARDIGYAATFTGISTFLEPLFVGATVDNYFKGEREKRERFASAVNGIRVMVADTLHNKQSHVSLDNYQGQDRQNILNLSASLRDALSSDDAVRRLTAEHIFAWTCIAPTGDKTVYKKFVENHLPYDPNEQNISAEDQLKVNLFIETLDSVTNFMDNKTIGNIPDGVLANAMIEATFRTMSLILDPNSDAWKNNEFILQTIKNSLSPVVNETTHGAPHFRPFQSGDQMQTTTNTFGILLDPHN